MSSPGEQKDNKCDVNNGDAWRGRPLLQRAQGEHRPRHRTPQQAEYLGPICLRQLSDWQDHLIYDSSWVQVLVT